jgi:hypothetical protein
VALELADGLVGLGGGLVELGGQVMAEPLRDLPVFGDLLADRAVELDVPIASRRDSPDPAAAIGVTSSF